MSIRKKGYYSWDGQLKSQVFYGWPIFFRGIQTAFKKKYAKAIFGFAALPFVVFLSAVYVSTKPELMMLTRFVSLLKDDAAFFNVFFTFDLMLFNLLVICVFFGSDLISADLKFNALPLYFSRPLDQKDYILGKYSILMFYLLLFSLLPGILLVVFKFVFTGSFSIKIPVLMAVLFFPIIMSVFFSSLTLIISSFSSNRKFVWIALFLIYIFSGVLAEMLNGIFKNSYFFLFSIEVNVKQTGSFLFQTSPSYHMPPWISFAVLVSSTLLMVYGLYRRITKSEAQIESGG